MFNFFFSLPKSEISQFQLFTHNWKCQYALLGIVYSCTKKYIWFLCGILGLTVQKLKSLARNVRHFKKCFFLLPMCIYLSFTHSPRCLSVSVHVCTIYLEIYLCVWCILYTRDIGEWWSVSFSGGVCLRMCLVWCIVLGLFCRTTNWCSIQSAVAGGAGAAGLPVYV